MGTIASNCAHRSKALFGEWVPQKRYLAPFIVFKKRAVGQAGKCHPQLSHQCGGGNMLGHRLGLQSLTVSLGLQILLASDSCRMPSLGMASQMVDTANGAHVPKEPTPFTLESGQGVLQGGQLVCPRGLAALPWGGKCQAKTFGKHFDSEMAPRPNEP